MKTGNDLEAIMRDFVVSYDGKSIEWGADDCAPLAAKWIKSATGIDLDVPFYDSREGGQELIREFGDLVGLCADIMARAGFFERQGAPQFGDVGIMHTSISGDVGGIFAHGGLFIWRHEAGVSVISPRPDRILKVWAVLT